MKTGKLSLFLGAVLAATVLFAGLGQAAERTVKIAIGSTSFAWFPLYVAVGGGFFKEEGLDVEIVNVPANSTPAAAMINGSVDLGGLGVQTAFNAIEKGQPIKILTPMVTEYTSTIFARPEILRERGVDRNSPIADRVKAMVGMKLATTAIGACPHLMYRYLFKKYLNGDVDKLAEVVPVGNAAPTLAAMKRGIVDASAFSPPVPEKAVADGIGEVLIDFIGGDVPEIAGSTYVVLVVTDEKLKTDGPMVAAFVRALERAGGPEGHVPHVTGRRKQRVDMPLDRHIGPPVDILFRRPFFEQRHDEFADRTHAGQVGGLRLVERLVLAQLLGHRGVRLVQRGAAVGLECVEIAEIGAGALFQLAVLQLIILGQDADRGGP